MNNGQSYAWRSGALNFSLSSPLAICVTLGN